MNNDKEILKTLKRTRPQMVLQTKVLPTLKKEKIHTVPGNFIINSRKATHTNEEGTGTPTSAKEETYTNQENMHTYKCKKKGT